AGSAVVRALGIFALFAVPMAILTLLRPFELLEQVKWQSLWNYMRTCPGCLPAAHARMLNSSLLQRLGCVGANWLGHFMPSFLFFSGNPGDHWVLLQPPGFGALLA